jgi:hypothetical protein
MRLFAAGKRKTPLEAKGGREGRPGGSRCGSDHFFFLERSSQESTMGLAT